MITLILGKSITTFIGRLFDKPIAQFKRVLPHDAMLARYVLSSCIRLSVCLSVTNRYCIETAKGRITQLNHTIAQGL